MKRYLENIPKSTWGAWKVLSVRSAYGFFDGSEVDGKRITSLFNNIGLDIDFAYAKTAIFNAIKNRELEDVEKINVLLGADYNGNDIYAVGRIELSSTLVQVVDTDGTVKLYFDIANDNDEEWNFGINLEVQVKVRAFDLDLTERKENKKMRKSLKEKTNYPKDWDYEEMRDQYWYEYLEEHDVDACPYDMSEFNELTNYGDDPLEAITRAFYGGRYGFKNDGFNPNDDYFAYNGYGNLISIPYLDDYIDDYIDEGEFYDWCVEQGYFESDEE